LLYPQVLNIDRMDSDKTTLGPSLVR